MALPAYAMNQASFPEMYERWLVHALFEPFARDLLDRLRVEAGDRLLDVACGTGIVARLAEPLTGPQGGVVGVDVSGPMLEVGRRLAPAIDWREGNVSALPIADGETFDVVTCQQGIQFFPERAAAAREMRRALARGGRLGISVWRSLEEHEFLLGLHRLAEKVVGPAHDQRYSFGDSAALAELLESAGFTDVRVETVAHRVSLKDGAVFARMNAMAIVGMSDAGGTMDQAERTQVVDEIVTRSASLLAATDNGRALSFPMVTNVATART